MMGHIRKRGDHSWEISVELPRDEHGARQRRYENVRGTKRAAETRLAELVSGVERDDLVKKTRMTLGEWLRQWLETDVAITCSIRTLDSYRSEVTNHLTPALGSLPLSRLTPEHLQSFYARCLAQGRHDGSGGLSPRTVHYFHRILHAALERAVKLGLVGRNIADAVRPPRFPRPTVVTMAVEDIPVFLKASARVPYHLVYVTALLTGMRLGELLGLRWCDLKDDLSSLSVAQALYKRKGICMMIEPKSRHSRRSIALPPVLGQLLHRHRLQQEAQRILLGVTFKKMDLVFANPEGKPLNPDGVSQTFSLVLKAAGLPHIRFHDLRHTHATLLLKAGVHPKIVQERLGHASIAMTLDTYSHVVEGLQAAAARRFEQVVGDESMALMAGTGPVGNVGNVGKMLATGPGEGPKKGENEAEPPGSRTLNLLIKRYFSNSLNS